MGNETKTGLRAGRRQFLLGTGSVLAMTALPLTSQARDRLEDIHQKGLVTGIVAYRESDRRSLAYASVLAEAGMTLLPLAQDPVRQWRDEVRPALENRQLSMYGLTDWSDYLLMRDLNAELRRFPVREEMQAQRDVTNTRWAAELAMETLKNLAPQSTLAEPGHYEVVHTGNLFAWEIN